MYRIRRNITYVLCLCKLVLAWLYVQCHKKSLYAREIWLFIEKHGEARDNASHLFRYIRSEHPEVNAYFCLTLNSADNKNVVPYGNVIRAGSLKHYVYYIAAKYSISSQRNGACPHPAGWVYRFRHFCRKDQKVVFLQHGITKDDAPMLEYNKTRFDLFVCAAPREYEHIHVNRHYPVDKVKLLGFCRYDKLYEAKSPHKQILIMPTFRKYLIAADLERDATEAECKMFVESDFYTHYCALLTDTRLLQTARELGYQITYYMHYSLQSFTKLFFPYGNDVVTIADRQHYDVQKLMIDSAIMVTDFSSVFFDFAYMMKPELFFQFDEQKFRAGHYAEGYFDYRRDGFGPVYTETTDVVDELIRLMKNGCQMESQYKERVNAFFAFRDNENCKRNYEAIRTIQ